MDFPAIASGPARVCGFLKGGLALLFLFPGGFGEPLFQIGPEFLPSNEPDAVGAATETWVIFEVIEVKSVVKEEFLPFGNFAQGRDPDFSFVDVGLAVRGTAVIDESGSVFGCLPV